MVTFPLSPLMHGGAQAGLLMHLFAGHLTILAPKFDPDAIWEIIERERVQLIFMTGDAMARPLIEAYEGSARRATTRSSPVRRLQQRGDLQPRRSRSAGWRRSRTPIFTDSVGASETGFQGMGMQDKENISGDGPRGRARPRSRRHRRGQPDPRPGRPTSARSAGSAAAGSVPLGYYKDPEKSAETFLEIDGARYSVPGDFARIEDDNKVTLLGRGSNCINTGGEKVYPEEVEMALKAHPDVYDVARGRRPRREVRPGGRRRRPAARGRTSPTLEELRDFLRSPAVRLQAAARGDLVDQIPRNATGKAQLPQGQGAGAGLLRRQGRPADGV